MTPTADLDKRVSTAGRMLDSRLGSRVRRAVPLAPLTTYRVGGAADLFVDVAAVEDLIEIGRVRQLTGVPVIVVGRGSNMLVADSGFRGIAVSIASAASDISIGADPGPHGERFVTVGGGVALPVLARRTAAASVAGFEWAVGVPGSVGGAVRMNAGGHGSDMASSLVSVDVVDLDRPDGTVTTLGAESVGLRFRASDLAPGAVVLHATLSLRDGDRSRSEALIDDIVQWRRTHQPGGQNCGSVFVNPVPGTVTAGALIDGLGLRGLRIGSAFVSDKHANFVQATPGGSAADVRAVIETVRERVADSTGHHMRSEVRLVGFDDADPLSFDEGRSA